ncbi:MAG: hypothetical protein JW763_09085 [candidate division Zixibacteria bacterium]|nr:hypothetical protein [candidate division Zixibacteria bacterium]
MTSIKILLAGLFLFLAVVVLVVAGASVVRADDVIVDIRDLDEGDLAVDGFEMKNKVKVSIHAIGAELIKSDDDMYAYGWIIDADTREPVWVMEPEDTRRYDDSRYVREYEDDLTLKPGRYEAYYFVGRPNMFSGSSIHIDGLGELLDELGVVFGEVDDEDIVDLRSSVAEDLEDFMLEVRGPEGSFGKFNPVDEHRRTAIVDFTKVEDDFYEKKGFTLKKDLTVNIIALGEYSSSDRVFVDFGWIIDANSREKVWQMDKWNTSWAGGGRKNRGFVGDVNLPAGSYVAAYSTDETHAFGEWNTAPPVDPLHYGLLISARSEDDLKYVEAYEDKFSESVVISLTKMRDSRFKQKGFTLDKEADIHIYAIGEYGYSDEFVDYGWIENVDEGDIVWEMTEENTDHAGGAKKNRKFDGVITLPPGNYMVYYVTDDSHSYRRWNQSPPIDREMWGITLYGVGKSFNVDEVKLFDDYAGSPNILVNLTGIGDNEEARERFTLDSPQKIRISALGEGRSGDMFDYGWIENAKTGEVIWEMTYRKTRHAGGADKNRKVNTTIFLEAGEYNAYFVTDGSHSFPDFNASRPNTPQKWGITISKTD